MAKKNIFFPTSYFPEVGSFLMTRFFSYFYYLFININVLNYLVCFFQKLSTSGKWEVVRLTGFGKFLEFLNFLSEFDNFT